jgi:ribosome assembly protein YihI (activator of Der GTPase)
MKKLEQYMKEHNIKETQAIVILQKKIEGWINCKRTRSKNERFELYAKERVRQKKNKFSGHHGSKAAAVRNIINDPKFVEAEKLLSHYKDCRLASFKRMNQLVTDPRQQPDLLKAFRSIGEKEII